MAWLSDLLGGGGTAVVEPATLRDAARLAQLHGLSFHRGWGEGEFEAMLSERNTLVHRLKLGRKIIGFAVSRIGADEAEILSIAIDPDHRGRGLSRNLLLTHLGHLAGRGIRTVFLEVEENNHAARRLYDRAGFSVAGRRERYYKQADAWLKNEVEASKIGPQDSRESARLLALAARATLYAFDYDGTLAPIVARPEDAVAPTDAIAALERLGALAPVAITRPSYATVSPDSSVITRSCTSSARAASPKRGSRSSAACSSRA